MTTVRSLQKAQAIKEAHPTFDKDRLDFAIVEDIAQPDGALREHTKNVIDVNKSLTCTKHLTKLSFLIHRSRPLSIRPAHTTSTSLT